MTTTSVHVGKQAAGKAAANLIHDNMIVGLGTGSTATYFIANLIERCRSGLRISAVATSHHSEQQALEGGIPIVDINSLTTLDVVVDGADEIDHQKRMIKGGGGALLREKIAAHMAREMIVIVDESKLVTHLGSFPLPIEVTPFACNATLHHIQKLGYDAEFRRTTNKNLYITDNGNFIVDIRFNQPILFPEEQNAILRSIPGVIETGLFFNLAHRVLIGHANGSVTTL